MVINSNSKSIRHFWVNIEIGGISRCFVHPRHLLSISMIRHFLLSILVQIEISDHCWLNRVVLEMESKTNKLNWLLTYNRGDWLHETCTHGEWRTNRKWQLMAKIATQTNCNELASTDPIRPKIVSELKLFVVNFFPLTCGWTIDT